MNRYESLNNLFQQIRAWLHQPSQQGSETPPAWRDELERQLSLAIVDEEHRGVYQHVLLKFGNGHHHELPASIPLELIPMDWIFQSGLNVLDDESLAKLSLDLFGIEPLADRFQKSMEAGTLGEIWAEVFTWATPEEIAEEPTATLKVYERIQGILLENDDVANFREISDLENEQILQAFALRKKYEVMPFEHSRLFKQVRKHAATLEDIYRQMENCPTAINTVDFTTLYVRFHACLASAGPHQSVVEQACEFISEHESHHPLTVKRKAVVLGEHRKLLDAIAAGGSFGASDALEIHLKNSELRWLPEFHDALDERNASFFHDMQAESFLCVSTINVLPIESDQNEWGTVGVAAADAIGRGASILYLRPADATEWKNELEVDFDDFVGRIVERVQGEHPNRFVSPDEASSYVRSRVLLLTVPDDTIFVRTQRNRTCGYFWFRPGTDFLTERKSLLEDLAHPKIEIIEDRINLENFKDYLKESLTIASAGTEEMQSVATPLISQILDRLGGERSYRIESTYG